MDSTKNANRFRLHFVGANEDVPRLIRAYGQACDGEFGLVLRPTQKRGLLVLIKGQQATVWTSAKGEAPARPEAPTTASSAVNQVRGSQDDLPPDGPITLRGQWAGYLVCDGGTPRVMLQRNIASYAILHVESQPGEGWAYLVERKDAWFTDRKEARANRLATLADAIQLGVRAAMDLAAPACSYRDTRRRQAHDAAYAEKHPIKPAKEQKDPTAKLSVRPEKPAKPERPAKASRASPSPGEQPPAPRAERRGKALKPADAPIELPPPPRSAEALAEASAQIQDAASALPALAELGESGMADLLEAEEKWLSEHDLDGAGRLLRALAHDLRMQSWTEATSLPNAIKQVLSAIDLAERGEDPPSPAALAEARARVAALRETLESRAPYLARARWLLRYAEQAARSPRCKGPEQEEALAAVSKAQAAYDAARASFVEGKDAETLRALRKVAEPLLLAAAKIGRSCKAGQTGLFTSGKKAKAAPPAPAPEPKKRGRPRNTPAPEPAEPESMEVDPVMEAKLMEGIEARLRKILSV